MAENQPQLQSSLGEVTSTKTENDRVWDMGYLALGQVTKVHPKRYTADVEIYHTNDKIASMSSNEGRHSCRIGVGSAGFNNLHNRPFGEINPIHAGDIVLVGFLKNSKQQPVIIKTFHSTTEEVGDLNLRNILNNQFSNDTESDIESTVKISPIQDFSVIDKWGNFEYASHTKSFFVAKEFGIDDEKFDFEDLSIKTNVSSDILAQTQDSLSGLDDPNNAYSLIDGALNNLFNSLFGGIFNLDKSDNSSQSKMDDKSQQALIRGKTIFVDKKFSKPKKFLACFRDKFEDSATNWLKCIVNAAKTSLKIVKFQQAENKNTQLELDEHGTIKIKRQLDSRHLFDNSVPQTPDNLEQNPSKVYSEMQMTADGTILIQTLEKSNPKQLSEQEQKEGVLPYPVSTIIISPKGGDIVVKTKSKIAVSAEDSISVISRKGIDIKSLEGINMTSKGKINIASEDNIDMAAPDTNITSAVDIAGSMDMKGETNIVGNTTITGKTLVNARKVIVQGDKDTHNDTDLSRYGNAIQSICESFIRKKLMANMSVSLAPTVAILGMVNQTSGSFEGMKWSGTAPTMEKGCFGQLIKWDTKSQDNLNNFCTSFQYPVDSISAQLDFIQSDKGLGIDIEGLTDNSESTTDLQKTVTAVNNLYDKLEKVNNIEEQVQRVIQESIHKLPDDISVTGTHTPGLPLPSTEDFSITEAIRTAFKNAFLIGVIKAAPTAMNTDFIDYGDGSTPIVNVNSILHEKDTKTNGNDTVIATIEDALSDINKYLEGDIFEQVAVIAKKFDSQTGMNTSQWVHTNRKVIEKQGTGENSESTSTITRPAPINTKEQYFDRINKRYVYNTAENIIKRVNASWMYHNLFE